MIASSRIKLEDLGRAIAEGQLKELLIVLKADVQGSLEAVADQLSKLPQDKIKLRIIRQGVGAINEGDVLLAAASNAVVIGFNVRPDLCAVNDHANPREYARKFYVDSLVHEPAMLQYMIDLLGSNRIALGSDYPFPLGEHHPGKMIEDMQLDAKIRADLLADSALEWLALDRKDFE